MVPTRILLQRAGTASTRDSGGRGRTPARRSRGRPRSWARRAGWLACTVSRVSRADYGGWMAAAYDRGRDLEATAVETWESVARPFLQADGDGYVLDLGAGTGRFSGYLAVWSGALVVAVEPAYAMAARARAKHAVGVQVVVGGAESLPLGDGTVAAAWLSQVIHHVDDLDQAAAELARVVRPGGHVLLRGALGHDGGPRAGGPDYVIYRYFPAAGRVADGFPSRRRVLEAFSSSGFVERLTTKVTQVTAPSLRSLYERTLARADSTLAALDDKAFAAGLEALRRDAEDEWQPTAVVDRIDFIILRAPVTGGAP